MSYTESVDMYRIRPQRGPQMQRSCCNPSASRNAELPEFGDVSPVSRNGDT